MKKTLSIVIPVVLIALSSCDDNSETEPVGLEEAWTRLADFPKEGRNLGVGFLINDIVYVGMGRGATDTVYSDFWKFDGNVNEWKQIASPPTNTSGSVGFAINGKGYFCFELSESETGPRFPGNRGLLAI